jgi:ketosteroid isomerase-like protein
MTDFVVAEAGIRQLHSRYVDAVWRKDWDAFADCFAEDAEWRISGRVLRGRAEITAHIRHAMAALKHTLLTLRTPILEVGDGVATGRTYMSEQSLTVEGKPFAPIGIYYERFVDHGDRWRFSWRLFQTRYIGPPDMSGTFFEAEDFGPPPAMPPLDAVTFDRSGVGSTAGEPG